MKKRSAHFSWGIPTLYGFTEEVGFEPTFAFTKTVFKTAAFNHSATPPCLVSVTLIDAEKLARKMFKKIDFF